MENSEITWTGSPDDMTQVCGVLFTGNGFEDKTGCLKKEAHNDAHICTDQNGNFVQWEDDTECECGCWDDWESGFGQPCMIYREITKAAAINAMNEHLKTCKD